MVTPEQVGERYLAVHHRMFRAVNDEMNGCGLSMARTKVLRRLHEQGTTRQNVLAAEFGLSPHSITDLVRRAGAPGPGRTPAGPYGSSGQASRDHRRGRGRPGRGERYAGAAAQADLRCDERGGPGDLPPPARRPGRGSPEADLGTGHAGHTGDGLGMTAGPRPTITATASHVSHRGYNSLCHLSHPSPTVSVPRKATIAG